MESTEQAALGTPVESVDDALAAADQGDYVLALYEGWTDRWVAAADGDEYRWLIPDEGRDTTYTAHKTTGSLNQYDEVRVVARDEAPESIRQATGGWFGLTPGGGQGAE